MQTGKDTLEGESVLRKPQNNSGSSVCEAQVQIKNADGLHMRPAMQFVDLANQFDSDISVSKGEGNMDGKSIMQVSMLAATYGTKLKITADGPDAQEAVDALRRLVEEKMFDEPPPKE